MKYKLAQVDDIIIAFNSIQQKQDSTNANISRLSNVVSSINTKLANQINFLKTQVYLFSSDMGWLGIWDTTEGYLGFVNVGVSTSAKIVTGRKTENIFLLGENGAKIFVIDPYLPGIIATLPFNSVASFTVSPDGQSLFVSENNSLTLTEVEVNSGRTLRKLTLPGTAHHLTMHPEAYRIYFSVPETKAVYNVQQLSGEVSKVFDLPNDAEKITHYKFGEQFGLLVLSGSGDTAKVTKWDKGTNTTSTVDIANAVDIVANPFTGYYYVASQQNILFLSPEGAVLQTVNLGDTAQQLTLTADGKLLTAIFSAGKDAVIVDTITGITYTGPGTVYPPTQQTATLLLAQAKLGFSSN
ncbi:YncE family protein [Desulfolucanica intricata]|uniref:YncE family protein n=1 Tax=Desulfolucanica intricata TaxID=1285191 RepID=UPI000832F2C2|nr:hypothetical protein [Desulfolucanica intricata]